MKEYLEQFGIFTPDEITYFLSYGKETVLSKADYFIKEGETAKRVAYVKNGMLRSFYYSSTSDEVTYCFSCSNELIAGYSSLITGEPTNENIQAITDCELIEFPKSILDELANNTNWLRFSKQMAENQYVKLEKRIFLLQKENATIRYKKLLEDHIECFQEVPLGYLASYLGISQRHLSRLRKQITF